MAFSPSNQTAKKTGGKSIRKGHLPSKRSINLAVVGETKTHMELALPGIIIIIILAALFSKFLVIDRINEVSEAEGRVRELQSKIDADYRELRNYDDISELYAHYTYSGMTMEEVTRTDRVEILTMLERIVTQDAVVNSWSLKGNTMTLSLIGKTLQDLNLLAQRIGEEEIVDYCTVSAAQNNTRIYGELEGAEETIEYVEVTATMIIYFNPEEGDLG